MSDPFDRATDAVFGFIWRWFWRIVIWGSVALFGLVVVVAIFGWANDNPDRWPVAVMAFAVAVCAGLLMDVRQLLRRIVEQNDAAARARRGYDS